MALSTALSIGAILITLISLAVLGVVIWIFVEETLFIFEGKNFTSLGASDWRRIILMIFIVLNLAWVCFQAIVVLFGGIAALSIIGSLSHILNDIVR